MMRHRGLGRRPQRVERTDFSESAEPACDLPAKIYRPGYRGIRPEFAKPVGVLTSCRKSALAPDRSACVIQAMARASFGSASSVPCSCWLAGEAPMTPGISAMTRGTNKY